MAKMPFANTRGCVVFLFADFSKCHFVVRQTNICIWTERTGNPDPFVIAARYQRGPRRRTNRR